MSCSFLRLRSFLVRGGWVLVLGGEWRRVWEFILRVVVLIRPCSGQYSIVIDLVGLLATGSAFSSPQCLVTFCVRLSVLHFSQDSLFCLAFLIQRRGWFLWILNCLFDFSGLFSSSVRLWCFDECVSIPGLASLLWRSWLVLPLLVKESSLHLINIVLVVPGLFDWPHNPSVASYWMFEAV